LRRLFSTFACGWPGVGLLLIRTAVGVSLIASGIVRFRSGQAPQLTILDILTIADGVLVMVGLWTPVAGSLVVILAAWSIFAQHANLYSTVLSAVIGAGLALIGPGAWSLDARLFGWKRIDLGD
jgi:putative oxidoreductase